MQRMPLLLQPSRRCIDLVSISRHPLRREGVARTHISSLVASPRGEIYVHNAKPRGA